MTWPEVVASGMATQVSHMVIPHFAEHEFQHKHSVAGGCDEGNVYSG